MRAEPVFTSAEVRHASKSCSRGRFYAISYMLKKPFSLKRGRTAFPDDGSMTEIADFAIPVRLRLPAEGWQALPAQAQAAR